MKQRRSHISLSSYSAKVDAQGNKICLNCDGIITARRAKKYCSDDCTMRFLEKNNHQFMRLAIIKELDGRCEKCGQQHQKLILDHIVPIAVGGAEFDRANLQLLCGPCNKVKTAADMQIIAQERRKEKILVNGQQQLPQ